MTEESTTTTTRRKASLRKMEDHKVWEARALGIAREWVNSRLKNSDCKERIGEEDFMGDLRTGQVLWRLIETLEGGTPVAEKGPAKVEKAWLSEESGRGTRQRMEALHNHKLVLAKLAQLGINIIGVNAFDLVHGGQRPGLAVIWAITRFAMANEGNANRLSVLRWAARRAAGKHNDDDLSHEEEDDLDDFQLDTVLTPLRDTATPDDDPDDAPRSPETAPDDDAPQNRKTDAENATPVFIIKNLDTGKVLDITPRTIVCDNGIVGDDVMKGRHHRSLKLWNGDLNVPTDL